MSIELNVEFLAGTSISEAIKEASELACKLNIASVKFNFNGVQMSVRQNADHITGAKEYFQVVCDEDIPQYLIV